MPQDRGAGRKTPTPRKFKIPEKGRIRIVLAVVLIIVIVKHCGPCISNMGSGERKNIRGNELSTRRGGNPPPASEKKTDQITFDELRQLIKDLPIGIALPEQKIIIDSPDSRLRGRNRDDSKDTLTLTLSIDTVLQKLAQNLLRRYKPRYGAVAAIDPMTGRVLALASYANEGEEIDGSDLYIRSIFPAASVFKTVVAAAGIEHGRMNARTAIPHFGGHHTLYRTQLQENLKVSKDISLQDAFAYSVNPAFARIALFNTNRDVVIDFGKRFGFHDTIPFEFDVDVSVMLSPDSDFSIAEFASGFNRETAISPLHGALIAGVVCNGGVMRRPTIVDSVRSSKRDTLVYTRETQTWKRAVREQTATELRTLMTKVTHYGTARRHFRPLRDSARFGKYEYGGKTGNVNKLGLGRVDWFVGYARNPNDKNQQIAVGVVTTHGEFWTVQSNFIASELFKRYIIITEEQKRRAAEEASAF
jgi:cell division protein FtsI/penicillin-binding protein 2